MNTAPAFIYRGEVMHRRLRPFGHRFVYRVFSLLLDIDRLQEVASGSRLFGYNRPAIVSFQDRDHGARDGGPLRPWVDGHLAAAGYETGGPITLLCFPRLFGFAFNPLSIFFCHDRAGRLMAVLHEVKNTFGQQHGYLLPAGTGRIVRQRADKIFYVSPFIGMDCTYRFRIMPPAERMTVAIRQSDREGDLLVATHRASRVPFSDRNLLTCLFAYPLMTLKVIGGIHWEALRLWLKGARLHERPRPPTVDVSLGRSE